MNLTLLIILFLSLIPIALMRSGFILMLNKISNCRFFSLILFVTLNFAFNGATAITRTSTASGNWATAGTWTPAGVPTAADDITILSGHTITMNGNPGVCLSLTIAGTANWTTARITNVGAGGLTLSNGAILSGTGTGTLNVAGDFTVLPGATTQLARGNVNVTGTALINGILNLTNITGTKTFGNISIASTGRINNNTVNVPITINGNLQNNGVYNTGTDAVTFTGAASNTITGTTATAFSEIIVNKGTSSANVLDVQSLITLTPGGLTLLNGTFKLSSASTITPFTADIAEPTGVINATSGLWNNGGTLNSTTTNWTVAGLLRNTTGTINLGNAADVRLRAIGGTVTLEGGNFNISGRLSRPLATDLIFLTITGGTLTVPTVSSTSTTFPPFNMDQAGSTFVMSGGKIVIPRAGASNLGFLSSANNYDITGCTVEIGDATTPPAQTIEVSTTVPIANLNVNSANATALLTSDISVLNDFNILSGTLNANNFDLITGRNWVNNGTFIPGTGAITFNGTGSQSITKTGGEVFYKLIVNKSGGTLTMVNNVTANNNLTLTSGNIDCGANTLTLGLSTASTGTLTYTSGTVIGKLKRWVNSTGAGISFPIGTSSYARNALITFTNITGGTLTTEFISSNPGSTGLPLSESGFSIANQYTEGYWNLTAANGLASTNYALELTGTGFTSYTIGSSSRLMYRANSGAAWSLNGTHAAATGNTAKRTATSGLSAQFALGKTVCSLFNASSITGSASVCTNTAASPYSVPNTVGNTYTWASTLGTVASGQGTRNSTINWGATAGTGSIQVTETNNCLESNTPVVLSVNVNPITTSVITGEAIVLNFQTASAYSVTNTAGYSYAWTITGGTVSSGQGTSSITVTWGAAGAGNVGVVTTRTCGGTDSRNLAITIKQPITSAASGNWGTAGTWTPATIPTANDYVVIAAGHTITMNGNPGVCYKLTINGTANWTAARTTNVGLGGISIAATGNVTGTFAGILTSTGGLTNNATLTSNTVSVVLQTTAAQTISGTGSLANLTVNASATNNGILTVTNTLAGSNTLTNGAGATLNINAATLTLTGLTASASGNTVKYGASTDQVIRITPYHHLILAGGGDKTLAGGLTLTGSLTIAAVTLDVTSSNYSVVIAGDWTNTGIFQGRFGTVTLNGAATQTITNSSGESFNTLTLNGAGAKNLAGNITVDTDLSIGSVFNAGAYNIYANGSWINTATFNGNTGTVFFQGASSQTLNGINSFNNLTINNSSGVSITSGTQTIKSTLTLTSGDLTTNGNSFTLLSSATGTGRIDGSGAGTISGNVKVQQYITGTQGYRYIGSAVSGATISTLEPEIRLDGMTGVALPGRSNYWCNVYKFDETATGVFANGWKAETNVSNSMTLGKGFSVYFYTAGGFPITIDVQGAIVRGAKSLPVTFRNNGDSDQGWNLVSNPYPSTIDWDASSGWTRTNIQGNTYYSWDNAAQQYAVYPAAGPGINGGTRYISSSQAFFVKASSTGPVLNMTENVKVASTTGFWKTIIEPASLKIKLSSNSTKYTDETVIRFIDGASADNDVKLDAEKIASTNTLVPYISTLSADAAALSINTFQELTEDVSIPVLVKTGVTGTYKFSIPNTNDLPANTCLILEDLELGSFIDLKTKGEYSFSLSASAATKAPQQRFVLHISPPVFNISKNDVACTKGAIMLASRGNGSWSYSLSDKKGNVIRSADNITGNDTITDLSAGIYSILSTKKGSNVCSFKTDTIIIKTMPVMTYLLTGTDVSCKGASNGAINVTVDGGDSDYSFKWSNGSETQNQKNLEPGVYTVEISDNANCRQTAEYTVRNSVNATNAIIKNSKDTVFTSSSGTSAIQFNALNSNVSNHYTWNFGDSTTSSSLNASHTYALPGIYKVKLKVSNSYCMDSASKSILVLPEPLSIDEQAPEDIKMHVSDNTIFIDFNTLTSGVLDLYIYNLLGQPVYKIENINSGTRKIQIPFDDKNNGIYLIHFIKDKKLKTTQKFSFTRS